jgi:iron(III) transport system ATP-binding protein
LRTTAASPIVSEVQKEVSSSKIEVREIVKRFGKVIAVDRVSFSVKEGEILGLLGPSGCGKTTVLRSIAGLEEIDDGEVILDGEVATSPRSKIFIPAEKRNLGLVFQSYALWPHMSVRENIAYCLGGRNLSKEEKSRRVKAALELVGLSGLEDRYPGQLSGGEQQRVALARSLSYEPKVILLDEPLSNLDLKVRERVRGELRLLLKRIGMTTVFVTHDQEESFVISDRVILMNHGKVIQEGTPQQLYADPANSFVAEFIGRANILKCNVEEVLEEQHVARIRVPDMGAVLMCEYDGPFPKNPSLVVIRYNEIGLSTDKSVLQDNVVTGELISREYRGSVTDHKVRVGGCQLVITTHKFCNIAEISPENNRVYIRIPPHALKLISG